MKRYAVAFTNLYDNVTSIEFLKGETAVEAALQHSQLEGYYTSDETKKSLHDLEDFCANCDAILCVEEVPRD